jgi:hypothetical protein
MVVPLVSFDAAPAFVVIFYTRARICCISATLDYSNVREYRSKLR